MNRDTMKHYCTFFLVLLICGGGCMYMPYIPARQTDLSTIGLDEHTRARLQGQADPRPNDPEPTAGFSGRLGVVPLSWNNEFYGFTANVAPSDRAIERLQQLDGVDEAYQTGIDLTDYHEALRQGKEPPKIDLRQRLLDAAQETKADLLLVYTTGHSATSFDLTLGIGQVLLLGYCPTVVFSAEADTTAVLMDAKSGYIYALTESEGDDGAVGVGWGQAAKKAEAATDASEESFDQIVDQLESAWPALQGIYP